jgi:hypothetical protein
MQDIKPKVPNPVDFTAHREEVVFRRRRRLREDVVMRALRACGARCITPGKAVSSAAPPWLQRQKFRPALTLTLVTRGPRVRLFLPFRA